MDDDPMDDVSDPSPSDERANVAAFMLGRSKIEENSDDDAEEAAALAEAAARRKERRKGERESGRAVAILVERAQRCERESPMDAVGLYTCLLYTSPSPRDS